MAIRETREVGGPKTVTNGALCLKCGEPVTSYVARGHGNEKVDMMFGHADGGSCSKNVWLLDAHMFEVVATIPGGRIEYRHN